MEKHAKVVSFAFALLIVGLVVWYANNVFLLAFASILLAIFLHAVGKGAQKITNLPYRYALLVAMVFIIGVLILTFWLYSPLISIQFQLLTKQLPQAIENIREFFAPYVGGDFLQKLFSFSNQKFLTQILSVFSTTLGSITGFFVFVIVGLYLAFDPPRYLNWIYFVVPKKREKKVRAIVGKIGYFLHWWILGKLLSMTVVGVLTFVGLSLLHVSLAFILGFLSAILTFIPYVGAILASIPAILIGFAQSPLTALYVTILYTAIHLVDGYFITPSIEQRTVSIPPAFTILVQVLMAILLGGIGLALATPLAVVGISLLHHTVDSSLKVGKQTEQTHND